MSREAQLIPIYLWVSVSLLAHLGAYGATTGLAPHVRRLRTAPLVAQAPPPAEVEFQYIPSPAADPEAVTPGPEVPPRPQDERERRRLADQARRRQRALDEAHRRAVAQPRPTPAVPTPTPPAPNEPVQVELQRRPVQYVHQDTPSEAEAPTDPHYLAQSNRTVEEETIARVRNLNRDDPSPRVGGQRNRADPSAPGDAEQDVSADAQNVRGDNSVAPHEAPRPRRAPAGTTAREASLRPGAAAGGDGRRAGAAGPRGTQGTPGGGGPAPGPVATTQGTQGTAGGAQGNGGAQGAGTAGGDGGQGGRGSSQGPGLGLTGLGAARSMQALGPDMSVYAAVYGPQEIERQRRIAAQRRSQARGSYVDDWRQTRAAIENFTPHVRVGNQTALRTAASPFAAYITAMHRRIHRLFADGFLAGLESLPDTSPLNDEGLHVTLEIVLERDGSVHRVGVVRTSGQLPFDVAAVRSVRRAGPYGDAPQAILSGDGRVYLHWGFYRSERQCGTFNVEPYILRTPRDPGPSPTPAPGRPPGGPGYELPSGAPSGVGALTPAGDAPDPHAGHAHPSVS